LLEHVQWLRTRLLRQQQNLERVFEDGNADTEVIGEAINTLLRLGEAWPQEGDYDFPSTRAAQQGLL